MSADDPDGPVTPCPTCGRELFNVSAPDIEEILPGVCSFSCPHCGIRLASDERGGEPLVKAME